MKIGERIVGVLLVLGALVTVAYWWSYFSGGDVMVLHDHWYTAFESSFPVADAWMAFCMLVCYWVPTTLYCGLSSHNRRYFTGLKWALLWHLDRELVPQDEEAVEILLNLA